MKCPLCELDTESPLGHLLLCGARFKRELEQAREISADLLAALVQCISNPITAHELKLARAAIAKATGEAS